MYRAAGLEPGPTEGWAVGQQALEPQGAGPELSRVPAGLYLKPDLFPVDAQQGLGDFW